MGDSIVTDKFMNIWARAGPRCQRQDLAMELMWNEARHNHREPVLLEVSASKGVEAGGITARISHTNSGQEDQAREFKRAK